MDQHAALPDTAAMAALDLDVLHQLDSALAVLRWIVTTAAGPRKWMSGRSRVRRFPP